MEVQAVGKYLRISPRKLVVAASLAKKQKATTVLAQLRFVNKKGAKFVAEVLKSAIANAKNNFGLTEENLMIKKIEVGKGPMLKRWRPVSRGRAHPILKRMSHLKIVLEGGPAKQEDALKEPTESKTVSEIKI